ncbi:hypothetical protein ACQKGL_02030 [Ensifer adhaerens]|uniref:hypothetical protein n=1 Tax=Ensifer adhaerens TaxID=106592 RepID=UPI003D018317
MKSLFAPTALLVSLTAPAYAFEDTKIDQWTVSKDVGGEMPTCEASATAKEGLSVTMRLSSGYGDAVLTLGLDPNDERGFNYDKANVVVMFLPERGLPKALSGDMIVEDHNGAFETAFPDRTRLLSNLEATQSLDITARGQSGFIVLTTEDFDGAALSKAMSNCLASIEDAELKQMAQEEIDRANKPYDMEQSVVVPQFINLADRISRIADACSKIDASFTVEDARTFQAKRNELVSGWKNPDEASLNFIRKGELETNVILGNLTPGDCPKLRLFFDDYMPVVLRMKPGQS